MADLQDGESIKIQGSASRPYEVKNLAGVYSCSCPAWRNQSLPIDRRTCKHLRSLRGDSVEEERIGSLLPTARASVQSSVTAPPLLLAETWDGTLDPTGWLLSEKLDGVRAYWDGKQFLSRNGNRYFAPDWFTEGLPLVPLDGELWIGRKQFQRTVSIVRRQDGGDSWREVRFLIFDAPANDEPFEVRLRIVNLIIGMNQPRYAEAHPHVVCSGKDHLHEEIDRIEAFGGEGLMLCQPGSLYETGRSSTLLKVKRFLDAEAQVVGHEPGHGRHKGRLGALLVAMANGTHFAVGTGFSDAERGMPPMIGSSALSEQVREGRPSGKAAAAGAQRPIHIEPGLAVLDRAAFCGGPATAPSAKRVCPGEDAVLGQRRQGRAIPDAPLGSKKLGHRRATGQPKEAIAQRVVDLAPVEERSGLNGAGLGVGPAAIALEVGIGPGKDLGEGESGFSREWRCASHALCRSQGYAIDRPHRSLHHKRAEAAKEDQRRNRVWDREEQLAGVWNNESTPIAGQKKRALAAGCVRENQGFASSMRLNHGGDVGRISWYSERSSWSPWRAGTSTRSSFISSRQKILRNLVMKRPSCTCPAS
jgi:DNA ligase-1